MSTDTVLEIGAGKGIITKELSKHCNDVIALELDTVLYVNLSKDIVCINNIDLINIDFLDYPLPHFPYKVFSNIPFDLTSRIIRKLYFSPTPPSLAYFIIQKEAIQKYMGVPHETQLSLLLKPFIDIKILYVFSKNDFNPKPAVIPVFVEIQRREKPLISKELYSGYRDFVVYGTTQWKASLKNSFKDIFTYEQFKRLASNLRFSISSSPLDLTFKQWIGLFEYYTSNVLDSKKNLVVGSYARQNILQSNLKKVYKTRR